MLVGEPRADLSQDAGLTLEPGCAGSDLVVGPGRQEAAVRRERRLHVDPLRCQLKVDLLAVHPGRLSESWGRRTVHVRHLGVEVVVDQREHGAVLPSRSSLDGPHEDLTNPHSSDATLLGKLTDESLLRVSSASIPPPGNL